MQSIMVNFPCALKVHSTVVRWSAIAVFAKLSVFIMFKYVILL